jgi:hypothetical protein
MVNYPSERWRPDGDCPFCWRRLLAASSLCRDSGLAILTGVQSSGSFAGGPFHRGLIRALASLLIASIVWSPTSSGEQLTAPDPTKPSFVVKEIKPGNPLRILVYGDMRFTDPKNTVDTVPRVRAWLARKVASEHPDAMLVTGDIPFHGASKADWQQFRQETADWRQNQLSVYPTVGNHEMIPDPVAGYLNYFEAFPQLNGYHAYSVLIGNVYIISLNSVEPILPTGYQADWLQAQLDHLPPEADFVFFLVHVPMMADVQSEFVANIPSADMVKVRHYLESKAAVSRAKFIVVSGHLHNYERFEEKKITHVISGGGGAKPYPVFLPGEQDLYRDNTAAPNFNYVIFTINGSHAQAKMYRVVDPNAAQLSVSLSDSFSLDAPVKQTPAP